MTAAPAVSDRMTCAEAEHLARRWADRGVRAFPVAISWDPTKNHGEGGTNKRPLTEHGHQDGTSDPTELGRLFNARSPRPGEVWGVGLHLGPSGYAAVDIDVAGGKAGDDTWADLVHEHGDFVTYVSTTPSGGSHVIGEKGTAHVGNAHQLGDDIDLRGDDGWIVAPGTRTPWGTWEREASSAPWPPAPYPRWVLDRITTTNTNGHVSGPRGRWHALDRTALHPADRAALEALERLGGHDPYIGGDGAIMIVRPGKVAGGSASIGHIAPGVVKVFTSNWPPLQGDARYDADELARMSTEVDTVKVQTLDEALATYRKWLHLPGNSARVVTVAIAAAAANLLAGDPLWLLIVGPPSSAKTESLSSLAPLRYVHAAATVTPAALLSGTPPKERAAVAKGGLLRQVGEFGIILCKDFTSVLAQNRDTRAEALAALREVYDGAWARPVGTAGGMVLEWSGKCGLIGGCTPTIDRHHAVMGTLGERFLLYRVSVDDPGAQARKRLTSRRRETEMRAELAAAVAGVLAGIGPDTKVDTDLDVEEWIVDLAVFIAKARTPVERDGYTREVVVMPESEGPARIATQLGALRDGLAVIGTPAAVAWAILGQVAFDAMPAMRRQVLDALAESGAWCTRTALMDRTDIPRTPIERELEDLVLIGLADREKTGQTDNTPWHYRLSEEARGLWPSAAPKCRAGAVEGNGETSLNSSHAGVCTYRGSTEAEVGAHAQT